MSEQLEKVGFYSKKFLFPVMITLIGVLLLVFGFKENTIIGEHQSPWFIYGAFAIFMAGIVTILMVLDVINRIVHLIIMVILFVGAIILGVLSYNSLQITIVKTEQLDAYKRSTIQSLEDIRTIQLFHRKHKGKFAENFDEIDNFLFNDKILKLTPMVLHPSGKVPDRQPNLEEIAILGYDQIKDESKIQDGIDLDEAMILGYFTYDSTWVPVLDEIKKQVNTDENRYFEFDASKVAYVPQGNYSRKFLMEYAGDTLNSNFMVRDSRPYTPFTLDSLADNDDWLILGELENGTTNGSWEE